MQKGNVPYPIQLGGLGSGNRWNHYDVDNDSPAEELSMQERCMRDLPATPCVSLDQLELLYGGWRAKR